MQDTMAQSKYRIGCICECLVHIYKLAETVNNDSATIN